MELNVSHQIAALAQTIATNRASLELLVKSLDDKPGDTTVTAQIDQLSAGITRDSTSLVTLQGAERALMARALPLSPAIITAPAREVFKPDYIFRSAVIAFDAYHSRRSLEEVAKERYGDSELTRELMLLSLNHRTPGRGFDQLTFQMLTRAAQNPAMTYVPGYAQELVQQTYAAFMDLLKTTSAVAKVAWASDSFVNGAPIVVPYRAAKQAFPDNFEAAFRAEGAPIRVGRLTTGARSLYPYSMGVIGTFSRELMRRSTPKIEELIRAAMLDDTAAVMDNVIFGAGAAVVGVRPAGLTNGIDPADTHAATATPTLADIDADLNKLVTQLVAVRLMGGPSTSWIMNTANAIKLGGFRDALGQSAFPGVGSNGGNLKGYAVATSSHFPLDQVLLVDGAGVFMAGGTPEFEMSTEATLHEENTAPLPIGSAGAPAVVAAPVRSLYQTNSAALRMLEEISWDEMRTGAVQQLTGVAW